MPLPHGWRCCALHTRAITARRAAARQRAGGDAAHCTRALSPHGVLSHGNVRAAMLSTAHARYRRRAGSHPAELGQPRAHRRRPVGPVSAGQGQRAAVPAAKRRGCVGGRAAGAGGGGSDEVLSPGARPALTRRARSHLACALALTRSARSHLARAPALTPRARSHPAAASALTRRTRSHLVAAPALTRGVCLTASGSHPGLLLDGLRRGN